MTLSENLKTWDKMDLEAIKDAHDKLSSVIAYEPCNSETRGKLKKLMEVMLSDYIIKCDDENNPPAVVNSRHIIVRVSTKKYPDGSHNYVNVIF